MWKKIPLTEPAYSQVILDKHVARVKATSRERIELRQRLKSLRAEKMAIAAIIISVPTDPPDSRFLKELCKVDGQIAKCDIELNDEVEMKLTDNEKMAHSNVWHTHQKTTESLKKSRGRSTLCYWASALKRWLTR